MIPPAQIDERSPGDQPVLVDTHVHLYDCFDRVAFFDGARKNFQHAAQALGLPVDTPGYLLLTETAKDHAFDSLIVNRGLDGGRWLFREAGDGLSLLASLDGQDVLTVIAGRQIVTQEGLEVLALCCNETFTDGLPVEQTVSQVIETDGLPVLPYGVGKWSRARGKVLEKVLSGPHSERLFLGDNAGRLAMAGEPKQFAEARKQGVWVLPGTDPLPFANQALGVGRFGMVLDGGIDQAHPAASIKAQLSTLNAQPTTYGRADGLLAFLRLQVAMQIRKRLRREP